MAGEIQLNGTTALTESGGVVTLNNVDSATNRTNLGLGSAATSASTAFASSSTTITAGTGLSGGGDLSTNRTVSVDYASTSEVQGTHTTGTVTSGTSSLTVASGSGITDGDYVVGEGITPGTTVSSGGGTTSITLSANAGATLSSDLVSFYKSNKVLSPGLVSGGLCRAWACFGPTGIRASYNITSVANTSAGHYTITMTTTMPHDDYAVVGMTDGYNTNVALNNGYNQTTSDFKIQVRDTAGNTFSNADPVNIAVFY